MINLRSFILFILKITVSLPVIRSVSQTLNGDCMTLGNEWCKVIGGWCEPETNKCVCKEGYVQTRSFFCIPAKKLGETCTTDAQCYYKDVNSYCASPTDRLYDIMLKCICKPNYHIEVVNSTKRCKRIYGDSAEEIKEGLTAAPIILCFMACVVVEAFCLLAFRYWKKHQAIELQRQRALFEIHPSNATAVPSQSSPFGSLVLNLHDSHTLSSESCSPPPYNSTIAMSNSRNSENEEPPPSYEEAVKNAERLKEIS